MDSNVRYFDDVPLEFLPDMLGLIQQNRIPSSGYRAPSKENLDVEPISIVYEIVRRWDKALSTYESFSSFVRRCVEV